MRNVRASVEMVGITGIQRMTFIADLQKGQKNERIKAVSVPCARRENRIVDGRR
jgi:hypothetical protein